MKQKFSRLIDVMEKKPREGAEALKKIFPEGLRMQWFEVEKKWEIKGVMLVGRGMRREIEVRI